MPAGSFMDAVRSRGVGMFNISLEGGDAPPRPGFSRRRNAGGVAMPNRMVDLTLHHNLQGIRMRCLLLMPFLFIAACAKPEKTTERVFVCKGNSSSIIRELGGAVNRTFLITKRGNQVVSVKTNEFTYTPERIQINKDRLDEKPIYRYILMGNENLTLRTENTATGNIDLVLSNTGSYVYKKGLMGGTEAGQCTISEKAF